MLKHISKALAALVISIAMTGCDTSSELGSSLVQDQVTVVVDSSFTVTGHSVAIDRVQSRTVSQLLGRIDAQGFGRLSSDVVTQFMPSTKLDTEGVTVDDIDSLVLYMYMARGEFVGDSVAPMGLDIYRLDKRLPSPIYSDFDAADYYSPDSLLTSVIYNIANNSNDTILSTGVEIKARLPKRLGRELYSAYLTNPDAFATPSSFADQVFEGLYIKNSYGSGRMVRISNTLMTLYYHSHSVNAAGRDTTIYKSGNYFAVTPEIVSNNNIDLSVAQSIDQQVAEGQQIVLAPVGLKVEMEFPAREILATFRSNPSKVSVLNSVTLSIPAENITNDCNIVPPTYLLMVLSKDEDKFFADNSLPDNKTSFYATYNAQRRVYDFGQIRNYLISLLDKGELSPEDYTFSLVPVSCIFETNQSSSYYYYGTTSQTLATMMPYMASPTMARLRLDQAKVKLTYSSQQIAK